MFHLYLEFVCNISSSVNLFLSLVAMSDVGQNVKFKIALIMKVLFDCLH